MTKRWVSAAICGAVLSTAAHAAAVDPAAVKQAQDLFQEGNRRFEAADFEAARVAYTQSLVLVVHGSTLRNLGNTEMKLGDPVSALKHLRAAVSAPDMRADRKPLVKQELDGAYAATGHLAVSTRQGAEVVVDGKTVEGTAPFAEPIDVTPGKHAVEAHLGAQSAKVEVDAKPGQVTPLDVPIETAAAPATPTGLVPAGPAPSVVPVPPPPSDDAQRPLPGEPPFWSTRRTVGVVVGGAGVLALGASLLFNEGASNQRNQARSLAAGLPPGTSCTGPAQPTACGLLKNDQNTQKTDGTLSAVFLGTGAAAVVVGGLLFFWPSSTPAATLAPQASIVPFVSPHGGGLLLRGEL